MNEWIECLYQHAWTTVFSNVPLAPDRYAYLQSKVWIVLIYSATHQLSTRLWWGLHGNVSILIQFAPSVYSFGLVSIWLPIHSNTNTSFGNAKHSFMSLSKPFCFQCIFFVLLVLFSFMWASCPMCTCTTNVNGPPRQADRTSPTDHDLLMNNRLNRFIAWMVCLLSSPPSYFYSTSSTYRSISMFKNYTDLSGKLKAPLIE